MINTEHDITLFLVVTTSLILLLCCGIIIVVLSSQKRQLKSLQKINALKVDYEASLIAAQFEIQEATLRNVAQELHDNVNLSLTIAKTNLHNIDLLNEKDAEEKIKACIKYVGKSINNLTDLSRTLNTDFIKHQGLIRSLEAEAEGIRNTGVFDIETEFKGDPVSIEAGKTVILFRIVQEALKNILKHSRAKVIRISLCYEADYIKLTIKDDGKGFEYPLPEDKKPGSGLINMNSRLKALNGSIIIKSAPGEGTLIEIIIPY